MSKLSAISVAAACVLLAATAALGQDTPDVRVSSGSPTAPFSQNKQNEPTIAIDANHPAVLVSGSNDNIDMEACNAGDDTTCPFTGGVGVSGVYFSFDSGQTWTQPSSSRFFGNVYVCWANFAGQEKSPNAAPAQLQVAVSTDGGNTWKTHPIGAAANNGQRNPLDGCTIRTDSNGNAYVFGVGTLSSQGHNAFELLSISSNGGGTWSNPQPVAGPVTQPGTADPVLRRPTIDGIAGART